ncbi:hypothetical protein TNCV_1668291 [Trichonephila clavipes]|nr:hypothetical protein TNCV_1668291 [Trichonephila clavipes]
MRVNMSRKLMDDENDSILKKIVTSDETWCFLNNPQTNHQSSEWKGETSLGQKPRENVTKQQNDFPKNGFHAGFEQLYERWNNCWAAEGQ